MGLRMTASTVIDSLLFRDAFGTAAMRAIFSDASLVARYVEVEVALATAEARVGVIPADAAIEIAKRADAAALDVELLRQGPISSATRSFPSFISW
jgi:3-carboxy-cis,cis-muconate cycloisomerase